MNLHALFADEPWADVRGRADAGAAFGRELGGSPPGPLHRYAYWRRWSGDGAILCLAMANPSIADDKKPDPTTRRGEGWAKRWNPLVPPERAHLDLVMLQASFSALLVVNRAAFISTDPMGLLKAADPKGEHNDDAIRIAFGVADRIVVAWGDCLNALNREGLPGEYTVSSRIDPLLRAAGKEAWCFGKTALGNPKHPGRIAYDTPLERWP